MLNKIQMRFRISSRPHSCTLNERLKKRDHIHYVRAKGQCYFKQKRASLLETLRGSHEQS
jgi:hypothetical protein